MKRVALQTIAATLVAGTIFVVGGSIASAVCTNDPSCQAPSKPTTTTTTTPPEPTTTTTAPPAPTTTTTVAPRPGPAPQPQPIVPAEVPVGPVTDIDSATLDCGAGQVMVSLTNRGDALDVVSVAINGRAILARVEAGSTQVVALDPKYSERDTTATVEVTTQTGVITRTVAVTCQVASASECTETSSEGSSPWWKNLLPLLLAFGGGAATMWALKRRRDNEEVPAEAQA